MYKPVVPFTEEEKAELLARGLGDHTVQHERVSQHAPWPAYHWMDNAISMTGFRGVKPVTGFKQMLQNMDGEWTVRETITPG